MRRNPVPKAAPRPLSNPTLSAIGTLRKPTEPIGTRAPLWAPRILLQLLVTTLAIDANAATSVQNVADAPALHHGTIHVADLPHTKVIPASDDRAAVRTALIEAAGHLLDAASPQFDARARASLVLDSVHQSSHGPYLVQYINRLIRQETICNVSMGKRGGGNDCRIFDFNTVMNFVSLF